MLFSTTPEREIEVLEERLHSLHLLHWVDRLIVEFLTLMHSFLVGLL